MTIWYRIVVQALDAGDLFIEISLIGSKVRAGVDVTRFLDIHDDPTSRSYSSAFIDLELPYPGDKRLFGWDDYPHEGVSEIEQLASYPHHFHRRAEDGSWIFEAASTRGDLAHDLDEVIDVVADHRQA